MGEDPAPGITGQATVPEPGWSPTTRAEHCGAIGSGWLLACPAADGDALGPHHLLQASHQRGIAQLQSTWSSAQAEAAGLPLALAAGRQGQNHFHRSSPATHHLHRGGQVGTPGQEGLQGANGQASHSGGRRGHAAHVQAQPIPTQRTADRCGGAQRAVQLHLPLLQIQAGDFGLHKAHPCCGTEAAKVNGAGVRVDLTCQHSRNQAAVEAGAAAAHQGDGCGRGQGPATHGPVAQHQDMAVATTCQHHLPPTSLPSTHAGALPAAALGLETIMLPRHKCAFW